MAEPQGQAQGLPAIAFIGAGSMGGAILSGVVASGIEVTGGIRAVNRTEASAALLRRPGVLSLAYEVEDDATERALAGAKLVVLGVKPSGMAELLDEISPMLDPDAVVVSIAAGVTIASMEARVANPVVRTMPNTPATVRQAVTGIAAGSRATASNVALVARLFETVGRVLVVPEAQLDALSAISGSGPAYVYFLIEQLTAAAERLGFTKADAQLLAEGTFVGAGALLASSDADPAELRRRVTSPKGTTERAIAMLETGHLAQLFEAAARAAVSRAKEIAAAG